MTRIVRLSGLVLALAVTVLTPAVADTFLVYNDGGIPIGHDIALWCREDPADTGLCASRPFSSCDTPEGNTSFRAQTINWAGFGFHLATCGGTNVHCWGNGDCNPPDAPIIGDGRCYTGGNDLSAFENGELRFSVKSPADLVVEIVCVGGGTQGNSLADFGWVPPAGSNICFGGTNDGNTCSSSIDCPPGVPTATCEPPKVWQEVAMPICSFFSGDVCTPEAAACLSNMIFPIAATIARGSDGDVWGFQLDNVRWVTENSHPGPSSVEVQGRQLVVNGEPFVVNALAYSPIKAGESQAPYRDHPDRYAIDFPLIAASGANAIRVYTPVLTTAMLDAAWAAGLYVIPTLQVDALQLTCDDGKSFMEDRVRETVLAWKDHPAILMWLIGNEVNENLDTDPPASLCDDWYPQLDALAQAIHDAEGDSFHPVGTAVADSVGLADICQPGCSDDTSLPNVDFWTAHVYRGCSFGGAFDEYAAKADCARPLIIGEFGADAWDSMLGGENQSMQSDCLDSLLNEADEALAVRTAGGVSSGQVLFEWQDEWWKAYDLMLDPPVAGLCDAGTDNLEWTFHDTCANWTNPAYPDPAMNEEWWGITGVDGPEGDPDTRGLRTSYDRVSESWRVGAVCSQDVVAHDGGTGDLSLSFDPGASSTDHTLHYGPLADVSTYGYTGSVSGLGAMGAADVTLPAESLFWVVVAKQGGLEGCYGTDSASDERPGSGAAQATFRSCECSAP